MTLTQFEQSGVILETNDGKNTGACAEALNGPNVTTKVADNFGMLIVGDGMKIFYAGEMYSPSGMDVTPIEVDIILVPVGGHYTFGPKEEFEELLKNMA